MSNIKRSDVQDLRIAEGAANLEKDKAIWFWNSLYYCSDQH